MQHFFVLGLNARTLSQIFSTFLGSILSISFTVLLAGQTWSALYLCFMQSNTEQEQSFPSCILSFVLQT
ncbi:unnamed protein product [Ectocarpus sp. 12 AP-2014]